MKIIKFEPSTTEDEILKKIRGKSFFAVTATPNEDGSYHYEWHFNDIPAEMVVFGCELVKNYVLNKCE